MSKQLQQIPERLTVFENVSEYLFIPLFKRRWDIQPLTNRQKTGQVTGQYLERKRKYCDLVGYTAQSVLFFQSVFAWLQVHAFLKFQKETQTEAWLLGIS